MIMATLPIGRAWTKKVATVIAMGIGLATAGSAQTVGDNAIDDRQLTSTRSTAVEGVTDWVQFDLADERSSNGSRPADGTQIGWNRPGVDQHVDAIRNDDWLQLRIMRPAGRPLDADGAARSFTGTTLPGVLGSGDETISQLDIQLGGDNGLSLRSSFGLSSQPREVDPADMFFLRGNQVREDRAVANIGLRF
ncbi:MAG: hypothetical protein ACTS1X_00610 [Parasphingopyxis sp.]|uniref:hypothetical protein n=1 Tax=Parasphingopyxis sp. TaxID=1920299 RepID=UPI003F9FCEC8